MASMTESPVDSEGDPLPQFRLFPRHRSATGRLQQATNLLPPLPPLPVAGRLLSLPPASEWDQMDAGGQLASQHDILGHIFSQSNGAEEQKLLAIMFSPEGDIHPDF